MQVTSGVGLACLGSTLPAIFEPRTTLIVLGACRRESPKLEVSLIENPVAISFMMARAGAGREHQIGHDSCGLPLSRWYSRIEMAES